MSDSFIDHCKTFYRRMPQDLSSSAKHVLAVLFLHADRDGITYVGTETAIEIARMRRSAFFRAIEELENSGVLFDEGWEKHGAFSRTRRRRIDLASAVSGRRRDRSSRRVVRADVGPSVVPSVGPSVVPSVGPSVVPSVGPAYKDKPREEPREEPRDKNYSKKLDEPGLFSASDAEGLQPGQDVGEAAQRKPRRRPASDVEGFDEWYDLYARKEAPAKAAQAYAKAVKGGVPPTVLLACLRRHLPAMQRKIAAGERQYVPYPASWLNAERWADGLSNEQKRALCAPGSDVERLLDEALGTRPDGTSGAHSAAVMVSDDDLPDVVWNDADGPEPTQMQLFSWISGEYPNLGDGALAKAAFLKLAPNLSLFHKMRMAVEVQKKSLEWRSGRGKFIPTFSDWIEEKRWNDQLTPDPEAGKILVQGGF